MQRIQRFATVHTCCALIRINAAVCIVVQHEPREYEQLGSDWRAYHAG